MTLQEIENSISFECEDKRIIKEKVKVIYDRRIYFIYYDHEQMLFIIEHQERLFENYISFTTDFESMNGVLNFIINN
jgi:hypothetical protein